MKDQEIINILKAEIVHRSRKPEHDHDFSGPDWDKIASIVLKIARFAYQQGKDHASETKIN